MGNKQFDMKVEFLDFKNNIFDKFWDINKNLEVQQETNTEAKREIIWCLKDEIKRTYANIIFTPLKIADSKEMFKSE